MGTILAAPEVLFKGWGGWNVGDTAFFDVEDGESSLGGRRHERREPDPGRRHDVSRGVAATIDQARGGGLGRLRPGRRWVRGEVGDGGNDTAPTEARGRGRGGGGGHFAIESQES